MPSAKVIQETLPFPDPQEQTPLSSPPAGADAASSADMAPRVVPAPYDPNKEPSEAALDQGWRRELPPKPAPPARSRAERLQRNLTRVRQIRDAIRGNGQSDV